MFNVYFFRRNVQTNAYKREDYRVKLVESTLAEEINSKYTHDDNAFLN